MKICSKCKESKSITKFSKNRSAKDGFQSSCKVCVKDYQQTESYKASLKKYRNSSKSYKEYQTNYSKEYGKRYRQTEAYKESQNKYKQSNPEKVNAISAKRRASKLLATPKWLTAEELEWIELFYLVVQIAKEQGYNFHVDHIVPLQGKNVCGLHVPWNLQVIPAKDNLTKSNKY